MSNSEDIYEPNAHTLQALIAPVVAILFVCVGVIISVLVTGTRLQDIAEIARSRQIANAALDAVGRDLGRLAIGVARSQWTYDKLVIQFDETWAKSRLDGISNVFGSARALVLDADDRVVFMTGVEAVTGLSATVHSIVAAARTIPSVPPDTRTGFAEFDRRIYIAAASIIAPPDLDGELRGTNHRRVLLLMQPIGDFMLARLSKDFLLEDLRIEPTTRLPQDSSIDLKAYDGGLLGFVSWTPARPGKELRGYIIVPIALATLLAGLLLVRFIQAAARTTQEIRKGAEALAQSGEALEHSENKLKAILDGVADGIIVFDEAGQVSSANAAAAGIFGYRRDEILGLTASDLVAANDAGSRAGALLGTEGRKETEYCELTGVRKDGDRFIADAAISHITYQTHPVTIAIVRDVTEGRQAEETLNLLTTGMVLVDRDCRLLQANRSASRILDSGQGLALVSGRVIASKRAESEQFRILVESVCTGTVDSDDGLHAVMTIGRGDDLRPLSIMVAPLQLGRASQSVAVAAIFIRDLEIRQSVPPEMLATLFGLTPAEARVVVALVKGSRPQEVAEEFGVSLNTVRNQLKQIFSKTNTGRQSELISLVLSSAAFVSEHGFEIEESDPPVRMVGN